MKKTLRLIALIATFCIMFTGVPMLSGEMDANAASDQIKVTATCNGWTNTVALRWNKISNPEWGYAIVVNGKVYGHVTKTTSYYAVKKLRSGTKYSFRVRTWKKVRSKMYYNSSTKKWQWTDPGKKYCTKTNYGMRYVYGKCSNLVFATTAPIKYTIHYDANGGKGAPANGTKIQNKAYTVSNAVPTFDGFKFTGWTIRETGKTVQPGGTISADSNANYNLDAQWEAVDADSDYCVIGFNNYNGTRLKTIAVKYGEMPIYQGNNPQRASDSKYYYVFAGWTPKIVKASGNAVYTATYTATLKDSTIYGEGGDTPSVDRKTVTNYLGVTRTIEWDDDYGCYVDWDDNILCKPIQAYDKTVDGEFTDSNGTWVQKNGVTFKKADLAYQTKAIMDESSLEYFRVEMYNGDADKLSLEVANPVETITTHDYYKEPKTYKFIMKDGYRLVRVTDVVTEKESASRILKKLYISRLEDDLINCGFISGDINIRIKYDGQQIGSITYNPNPYGTKMYPTREIYLNIAKAAVEANGGPKSYDEDMSAIEDYVFDNYAYSDITCIGGALILESWSVYQYGKYGFFGPGYSTPDRDNWESHAAFHLDSDPTCFYQTQGHK